MLNDAKYVYKNMVNTFTGDCMEDVFPAFQNATSGSDADKVGGDRRVSTEDWRRF